MKKCDAETIRKYPSPYRGHSNITTVNYLGTIINNNWYYSRYWTNDNWVEKAKADAQERISKVEKDFAQLKEAIEILKGITE